MALNETTPGVGGVELKPDDREYFDGLLAKGKVVIILNEQGRKSVFYNDLSGTVGGKPHEFWAQIDLASGTLVEHANGTEAEVTPEFLTWARGIAEWQST